MLFLSCVSLRNGSVGFKRFLDFHFQCALPLAVCEPFDTIFTLPDSVGVTPPPSPQNWSALSVH